MRESQDPVYSKQRIYLLIRQVILPVASHHQFSWRPSWTLGQKIEAQVLNLEIMDIETVSLQWARRETLHVLDRSWPCKVIEIKGPSKVVTRWVSEGDDGVAVREVGETEDGPYALNLSRMGP